MQDSEKKLSVDTTDEEDAIRKGASSMGVDPSQIFVRSQKKLTSGLIRFELVAHITELSIEELIARVDIQLGDIDTRQFVQGYSSEELKDKGLLSDELGADDHRHSHARTVSIFGIPEGIDYCECEDICFQDYAWLESMQRITPCVSGVVFGILLDGNLEKAIHALGPITFLPPLHDDLSMVIPKVVGKQVHYIAGLPGRVLICKKQIFYLPVDIPGQVGAFNVENRMQGTCSILPPFGKGRPLTLEIVQTYLTYNKIKFGINNAAIENAIDKSISQKREVSGVIFAKGMPEIHGKDGFIARKFGKGIATEEFQITPDGRIDYHRKLVIPTAKEKDLLATVNLPTTGQPGIDIFGNMILAVPGRPLPMTAGEGVSTSADGREFYATRVGQVNYGPDAIQVFPVFQVDGDVDSHCGNVEFDGSIIILGSVLKGFSVKAKGNVEIKGSVECGTVDAGRDLIVSGGIVGDANSSIHAGRNLVARHLLNASVEVEGDVHVLTSCMYSTVETTGEFFCIEGKGVLVGGAVMAMRGGRAKEVGNDSGAKTLIVCGQDFMIRKKIRETQHISALLQEDLKKLDVYLIPLLQRIREMSASVPAEQKSKISGLMAHRKGLAMKIEIMATRLRRLEQSAVVPEGVKFYVYSHVYPGTRVQICESYWVAEAESGRLTISTDPKTRHIRLTSVF